MNYDHIMCVYNFPLENNRQEAIAALRQIHTSRNREDKLKEEDRRKEVGELRHQQEQLRLSQALDSYQENTKAKQRQGWQCVDAGYSN